ncbi:MAG: hypothetical protein KDA63_12580 [Planctomycetales bacterium]|nr:hypothetical protein [Planctomycetales bacterium]
MNPARRTSGRSIGRLTVGRTAIGLAALALTLAVAVLSVPHPAARRTLLLAALVYGTISAAVSLSAWWLTLLPRRPQREWSRHALVAAVVVWLGLTWQVTPTMAEPVDERTAADAMAIAWGYQWALLCAMLWWTRRGSGRWAIDTLSEGASHGTNGGPRFTIRGILIATAVVAVVLAVSRETLFTSDTPRPTMSWTIVRTLLICVAGGFCQAVVGLAASTLAAFGRAGAADSPVGRIWWRLPLSVAVAAAACLLQTACLLLVAGTADAIPLAAAVGGVGGVHFTALATVLSVLRDAVARRRRT